MKGLEERDKSEWKHLKAFRTQAPITELSTFLAAELLSLESKWAEEKDLSPLDRF